MSSCLYTGHLMHRRTRPVAHHFTYPVAVFYLDLDALAALDGALRLFGVNRRALVRYDDRDHMDGTAGHTADKLRAFLRGHGIEADGKIFLLTQCRIVGYVFNPVSFYYCHRADGGLRCVVAEVNNTFGERHLYVLSERNQLPPSATHVGYAVRKVMHVSPFVSMDAEYEFRFAPVGPRLSVAMHETERGAHFFDAHLSGTRVPLTDGALARMLVRYPFLTVKIIGAIHWQALRLYRKGVPVYHQPSPSPEQHEQLHFMQQLQKEVAR